MAGENASERAAESAVEATAAQAAATAAAEVATAESVAAAAVEHAEQRIETAERVVEQIADAAVQSELGRQVADACEKVASCLTRLETVEATTAATLGEMAAKVQEMAQQLAALTSAPPIVALLSPSAPPTSDTIPTPSPEPEGTPVAVIVPGDAPAVPAAVQTAPARRTRRLI